MVAYDSRSPRDGNRSLSPNVAAQLRSSLAAHWTEAEGHDAILAAALAAAAQGARARDLRPEELLLGLKAIEEDIAATLKVVNTQDRDRFRLWLVGACMRAYFAGSTEYNSE